MGAQEQRTLDQLQAQTWGVWLHEDANATRYVVLPRGTLGETWPVTVGRTRGRRLYGFVLANDGDTEAFTFTTRPRTHFKRAVARKPWH